MANYSLTLDTRFNPFTYAEMLAPVAAATLAHLALEDAYSEMETKASVWENMANELTDPLAYKMYKNYANDLEASADDLLRNGLNIGSRRSMMGMKSRFSKEIVPIELAFNRRNELAKELRSNPDKTTFYQRDARTMSLDDFINNPALDYGQSFSGAVLAKMTGDMANNLKTAMTGRSKLKETGLPFQYELLIQYGYTPEQIRFAIENPNSEKAVPVLNTIVQLALDASGMSQWASPALLALARAYATTGLYNAIGQTTIKDYNDQAGLARFRADLEDRNNARQHARNLLAQREAAALAAGANRDNRVNPLPLRDTNEISKANEEMAAHINSGFIRKLPGGRIAMTKKGWAEYLKTTDEVRVIPGNGSIPGESKFPSSRKVKTGKKIYYTPFYKWVNKIGAGKHVHSKNGKLVLDNHINDALTVYANNNKEGSYDTYHSTEYDRALGTEYGTEYLRQMKPRVSNGQLEVVEFKGREWKKKGSINIADLEDYYVSNVRYSKYGNTAIIQKKNGSGEIYRVRMPAGMHLSSEANVASAISAADDYGAIIDSKRVPKTTVNQNGELVISKDKKGNIIYTNEPLTDADIQEFKDRQDEALSDMGAFGSQYVVTSKTKEEEYNTFNN